MRGRATAAPRRRALRAALPALLALVAIVAAPSCTERPDSPGRVNPFDPGGTHAGEDPFQLTARATRDVVDLDWRDVAIWGRADYSVYRSRSEEDLFADPDTILVSGHDSSGFRDASPLHGAVSYYGVTVRNARGEESLRSLAAPAVLDLPPYIEIRSEDDERVGLTATRRVRVRVIGADAVSVLLSNRLADDDLAEPETLAYTGASLPWELLPNPPDSVLVKVVHARVLYGDASVSPIVSDTIFARVPVFQTRADGAVEGPVAAGRRRVEITLHASAADDDPPDGVDSVEVSLSRPFAESWLPYPGGGGTGSILAALERPSLDTVFVRAKNDFGIIAVDSITVKGDSLLDAAIVVNNDFEPSESETTRAARVNVHVVGASATAICLSNTPIPPCVPFDSVDAIYWDWALAPPAGRTATIYAILANEWRPGGAFVVSDSIFIQEDPLRVAFFGPEEGSSFTEGDTVLVEVIARRRTFGPRITDLLLLASGDTLGEIRTFLPAGGDTFDVFWETDWTIPVFAPQERADTLTARVTDASGEVVRDTIEVFVAPLGGRLR